jgi:hypothetical protein
MPRRIGFTRTCYGLEQILPSNKGTLGQPSILGIKDYIKGAEGES